MGIDANDGGEAWADILARRSPEGLAVVEQFHAAEKAALAIQHRILNAIEEQRDYDEDIEPFKTAMAEVQRMRQEIYRLATQ